MHFLIKKMMMTRIKMAYDSDRKILINNNHNNKKRFYKSYIR